MSSKQSQNHPKREQLITPSTSQEAKSQLQERKIEDLFQLMQASHIQFHYRPGSSIWAT